MDISDTIAPDSDQLDAIDLRSSGPRTFTVARVVVKAGDQPVDVHLQEFPRPWRPGKSMRRVLDTLWGPSAGGAYEGRRVTLYCDDRVRFGGEAVGGVRISHMSDIGNEKRGVSLIVSRGQVRVFTVQPLRDAAPQPVPSSPETPDPLKEVGRLMKLANITEREHAAAYVTDVVGREVASTKELTEAEVDTLVESLKREVGE